MMHLIRFATWLLPLALILAACDEEQVLYEVESEEPIPESPDVPASMRDVRAGNNRPAAPQELPEPVTTEFARQELQQDTQQATVVGLAFPLPKKWFAVESNSPMRALQYEVPHPGDPRDGEFVVFHFGEGQGGPLMANAGRWRSQFQPSEPGQQPLVRFQQQDRTPLTVSRMTLAGTWTQTMMPGMAQAPEPQENYMMDAVIVEGGPEGPAFLRLTGPRDLVSQYEAAMEHLAASVSVREGAAPAKAGTDPSHDHGTASGEPVVLAVHGLRMLLPEAWKKEEPASSMRSAQFAIPGAHSTGPGEMAVFYFGQSGGGSTQRNLDRWRGQVSGGSAEQSELTANGLKVTSLRADGTYQPSPMMTGGEAEPLPNHRLLGIVIEGGPQGPVYLRLTGPQPTMQHWSGAIERMLQSVEGESE